MIDNPLLTQGKRKGAALLLGRRRREWGHGGAIEPLFQHKSRTTTTTAKLTLQEQLVLDVEE